MTERFQACLGLGQGQAFRLDIGTMVKVKLDVDWVWKSFGSTGIELGLILSVDRKWW